MKTIFLNLIYVFGFIMMVYNKDIYFQLDFLVDDKLKGITIGTTKWTVNDEGNWDKNALFIAKTQIGDRIRLNIWNEGGMCFIAAIIRIGTTEFNTNTIDGWSCTNTEIKQITENPPESTSVHTYPKVINEQNIYPVGMDYGETGGIYEFNYIIPQQVYCSNIKINKMNPPDSYDVEEPIYYAPKGKKSVFDITEMIYKDQINPTKITLESLSVAKITMGDTVLEINQSYELSSFPLMIEGITFGEEVMKYHLQGGNIKADGCQVKVIVCNEMCKGCDLTQNICYASCLPIHTDTVIHILDDCFDIYHCYFEAIESIQSTFKGKDFNATLLISPYNDGHNLLDDFRYCLIKHIRPKYLINEEIRLEFYSLNYIPINKIIYYAQDQGGNQIKIPTDCNLLQFLSIDIKKVLDDYSRHYDFINKDLPNIIHLDDRTFHHYQTNDNNAENNILPNMTYIDISKCEQILKLVNDLDPIIPLTIYVINYKTPSLHKDKFTSYVLSSIGKLLDTSICQEMVMNFPLSVIADNKERFEEIKSLIEANIDIFNPEDPFFNDICIPLPFDSKTDIPRKDRINQYLRDQENICAKNCSFQSMNFTTNKAICKCSKPSLSTGIIKTFDELKDNLLSTILNANFQIMTCYSLVFDIMIIIKSYGSWVIIGIGLFLISNLLYLSIKSFTKLRKDLNSITILLNQKNNNKRSGNNEVNFNNNSMNHPQGSKKTMISNSNSDVFDKMGYEDILKHDKRGFCKVYWYYLLQTQPFLNSFIYNTIRSLKPVRIAKFLSGIMVDSSLSAFFYSDKYISHDNNNKGKSSFLYNLPVSLYTFLGSIVINLGMHLLSSSEFAFNKLEKINDKKILLNKINSFLRCYRIRITMFIFVDFILLGLFWYYVSAFCAVYLKSQLKWLISFGISLGITMIIPFLISLILACMRIGSIHCRCKCLYKVVSIIMCFL